MMKLNYHTFLLFAVICLMGTTSVKAQEESAMPVEEEAAIAVPTTVPDNALPQEGEVVPGAVAEAAPTVAPEPEVILSVRDEVTAGDIPSLFFTPDALALLKDAIQGLNTSTIADVGPTTEKDPGIRELALGGIVYRAEDDWTIWLNGRRITPDAIPGEIFDLAVYKEYVDIKWYDAFTNRLYPVRLRANERFNLDSRLFLSGSHSQDQQL